MVTRRKTIAIILARGGSKRLPRKNILPLGELHMIGWTIQAVVNSAKFSRILVSTDDEEIAQISRMYGAECPFLRAENADDFAPASEATISALHQASEYWQEEYGYVAQLMANCPYRTAADVVHLVEQFKLSSAPSQISCFRFGWMNPWWSATLDKNNKPTLLFPESTGQRSQDLPDLFCPSGAMWIADTSKLIEFKSFYMPGHIYSPLSWLSAFDIDDTDDYIMAQAVLPLAKSLSSKDAIT